MELKDTLKIEEKIRKWAGKEPKIKVRYCQPTDDFYFVVDNGKFKCLVNEQTPDKPYGFAFHDIEDERKFIKGMFKNGL